MPFQGISVGSSCSLVPDRSGCVLGGRLGWCVVWRFVLGSVFVRCVSGARVCPVLG